MKVNINQDTVHHIRRLDEFFKKNGFKSDAVSSYWKIFGEKSLISFKDDYTQANIFPDGFDDWRKDNLINKIKNIPIKNFIKKRLINQLPETMFNTVKDVAKYQNRVVSFNCIKHALSIHSIERAGVKLNEKKIAVIGDGNGFMGLLIKRLFPDSKIVQINLAKVLMFDLLFTSLSQKKNSSNVVLSSGDYTKDAAFNFIPAELIFDMNIDDIDFFINTASMQEMNINTVNSYFHFIRSQKVSKTFFYCCNRVSKKLPDGSMLVFDKYPWASTDKVIFDDICPWYSEFPVSRPPFIHKFDGDHKHRLIEV